MDFVGEGGRVAGAGDDVDEGAANDHAIRESADPPYVLGARDAESDEHGNPGLVFDAVDELRQLWRNVFPRAGDAGARDAIDEAGGKARDERDSILSTGGGEEEDRIQTGGARGGDPGIGLLRRKVSLNHAVHTDR